METNFVLQRKAQAQNSTWGEFRDPTNRLIATILERGAVMPDHPRIPAGRYKLIHKPGGSKFDARYKARFPKWFRGMIEVADVPGRSEILIHTANRYTDLLGCLGTGEGKPDGTIEVGGEFQIPPGTSMTAFESLYPLLYKAIDKGGAWLDVRDIQ